MKKTLADALEERGYTTLTPVQEAVTAPELLGADMLVSAQTGSGKTLGFGLAIAPTILGQQDVFDLAGTPLALVIAPTRELAMQVKRELTWVFAKAGAVLASCVGGMDMRDERRALARGAHIVVATPGRLRDHLMRGSIDLAQVRAIVLDEADEMLDLGFREDLEFILGEAPTDRQTLLFSATVPAAIASLAKSYQNDAVRVETKSKHAQHADIEYRALNVSERDAENAVINVLRFYEAPNAIVFCNTRAAVNRLTTRLSNRGFPVVALSGELSQSERTHALQAMRDGRARVCVATDVAARGIDLPNLDLVVHAELPGSHETLLHRSGRTGRAGRKGVSTLIVTPKSRKKAERILKWAKLTAQWSPAPSADDVRARDEERMLADALWREEIAPSEQAAVDKLTERFSAAQLAAAYLRMYHARHSTPEELSAPDDKPKPRATFGRSVWFSLALGRDQNAEPRRLLPMLCKAGQITKDDIGAIRVQNDSSFFEIRETAVAGFLAAIGQGMSVENHALMQCDAPPDAAASARPAPTRKHTGPKPNREPKPDRHPKPVRTPRTESAALEGPSVSKPGASAPIDWNDDPVPRVKKPKPAQSAKKPKKPKTAAKRAGMENPGVSARKPRHGDKNRGPAKPDGRKGPPPPPGKPNSKKNKARAAVRAKMKGKVAQGGKDAPRRGNA